MSPLCASCTLTTTGRDDVENAAIHVNELLGITNGTHVLDDNVLQAGTDYIISNDQQVANGVRFYIRPLTLTAGLLVDDYDNFFADSSLICMEQHEVPIRS